MTELDGAIEAFQTTVSGVDGDSLLGALPAIVGDLERIDSAWTALEGQIDSTCGLARPARPANLPVGIC